MRRAATRHARIGRHRSELLRRRLGTELRTARIAGGMTQRRLAALAGVSQAFVSMVECGRRAAEWSTACALASAVGHDLSLKLFPSDGVRIRDSGHVGLVQGIVAQADRSWHPQIEVPVAPGDRRAADLVLRGEREVLHIEVERFVVDFQAQLRAAQLKRAQLAGHLGRPVRLVMAVAGTRRNRTILRNLRTVLDAALPRTSVEVRRSILTGSPLGADGVLLLPPARRG
jgi:transcriptional regulator with XRE-family HTH domain